MHRFLLLLSALVLIAAPAEAQNRPGSATLTGRVVDADTDAPLPSASVAVWQVVGEEAELVTGAITTADGRFRLEGIRAGQYRVVLSYVGYQPEAREAVELAGVVDLGTVALAPDVEALEGVEVTAERDRVEVQIDRTVYNVGDDALSQSGTATTVLETIPSVDVDVEGNVSLRGVGNVAILINGRPAPVGSDFLASYLQSLPAGTLDRVEVIPNPSARYEPDGMGGVLNLVLKENTDLGLGGALTAGGDTRGGYSGTGLLTYGRGPLSLSASYGLRQDDRSSDGSRFRINRYDDPLTYLDQSSLDERDRFSHFGNLSADWSLSPRTTLSASAQAGYRVESNDEATSFVERDETEAVTLGYERLAAEDGDGWNGEVRLGFQHDFGTAAARRQGGGSGRGGYGGHGRRRGGPRDANLGSHTFALEASFEASEDEETEAYTEQLLDDGGLRERQQTRQDEREREATLRADYSRPLLGFRVEAGYQGDYETSDETFFSETFDEAAGAFVPDADLNNAFSFEEQIHAGYLQLGRQVGPVGVQVGLRAEAARTTFSLENTGQTYDNDYTSFFPSAFATYEVAEGTTLKASYSRRIHRPRTWFLNPFPSVDDPLNIRRGNPFLQPEYVDAVELGVVRYTGWGSLQLTPYARRVTDVIRRIQRIEDGVTISTFENLDTSSSYGVEAIASYEAAGRLDGLRGTLSLEGYRVVTDGTSVEADLANDAFGWGARLTTSYEIRGGLDLQANVRYRAPMDTEQGSVGARTRLDLALRQRLLDDRASLTLRARDPLGMAGYDSVIDQPNLYQEFERSFGGPEYSLSFTYAFGGERPQRQRDERAPEEGFDEMDY